MNPDLADALRYTSSMSSTTASKTSTHGERLATSGDCEATLLEYSTAYSTSMSVTLTSDDEQAIRKLGRLVAASRPHLSTLQEMAEGYVRVKADLRDPARRAQQTTSDETGSTPPSTAVATVSKYPPHGPLYRRATAQQIVMKIMELGYLTGHDVARERAEMMAAAMAEAEWTAEEIDMVVQTIFNDADLTAIIGYERTIGPRVFAAARQHPKVAEGRLFTDEESAAWSKEHAEEPMPGRPEWMQYWSKHFEAVRVDGLDERRWRFWMNQKRTDP